MDQVAHCQELKDPSKSLNVHTVGMVDVTCPEMTE
jgi:hypothetical protein